MCIDNARCHGRPGDLGCLDVSNDGLAALVHMNMFNTHELGAPVSQPAKSLELR